MIKRLLVFAVTAALIFNTVPVVQAIPNVTNDEVTSEEYARWKNEISEEYVNSSNRIATFATDSNSISNDYISAVVGEDGRFTIGTTGGNPSVESDDNKNLLFGHPSPWSSFTTIKIDDTDYVFEANYETLVNTGESIEVSKDYGGVEVKQILSLESNPYTQRQDIINIKYIIKNTDTVEHSIGTRIMLDTMLGSNDGAPFRLSRYGDITNEIEIMGNSLPQYWQAFDNLDNPSVVSTGTFYKDSLDKPDKVQFCNWRNIYNTTWDYTVNSSTSVTGDSAVAIYKYPTYIGANEELVVNTYYGLGDFAAQDATPPLGVRVSAPQKLLENEKKDGYNNNPFTIDAYIWNNSDTTATNSKVEIILPEGLSLVGSQNAVVSLGDIIVAQEKRVGWEIKAAPQAADTTLYYTIKVTADNAQEKTLRVPIYLPELESKPVYIILPGIMGSELYVQGDDGEDGIIDVFNEYKENGYRLWEFHIDPAIAFRDIYNLKCNYKGESTNKISADSVNDSTYGNDGEYGANKMYTEIVNRLMGEFGAENVKFFPYDWRLGIEPAAERLKEFIDENNYNNINIVAHSMGGLVACEYIRIAPEKKDNIKLITLGTPYLGAPTALYRIETGQALVGGLAGGYNWLVLRDSFRDVMPNVKGIYELLPTEDYFNYKNTYYVNKYTELQEKWYLFKNKYSSPDKLSYSETVQLINDRMWGNSYILNNSEKIHKNLSVVDIFTSVASYAIIGCDVDTTMVVKEYFKSNGEFKSSDDSFVLKGGDGTVPVTSANIGGNMPTDRDFYVKEEHSKLQKNEDVLDFVCEKLRDWSSEEYDKDVIRSYPYEEFRDWKDWGKIKIRALSQTEIVVPKSLSNEEENISLPNIKVYSPEGELIVEINDEKLEGSINDYGSFTVLGDGEEIILSLDIPETGDYIVEISGEGTYDIEMLQGVYSSDEEGNLDSEKYLTGDVIETELYKGTIENYELGGQALITVNFGKDGNYTAELDKDLDGEADEEINVKKALDGVLSDNTVPTIELDLAENDKESTVSIKVNDDISIDKVMYIAYNPDEVDELDVEPQVIYENTENTLCKEMILEDIYTLEKNSGEVIKIAAIDMNDNAIEVEYTYSKEDNNNNGSGNVKPGDNSTNKPINKPTNKPETESKPVSGIPSTGDESVIINIILAVSILAIGIILIKKRRRIV